MANLNEGFGQVKLDDKGTYGAYNPTSSQAVAFPDQQSFSNFFGSTATFDPNAPTATFDSAGLLGGNAGKVLSVKSLTPANSLTVPVAQPQPNPTESTVASATESSKSLDSYIKELTPPESDTSKQYNSLLGDLNTLLPGLTGRGEAQLSAEQSAGIPELKQKLAGLNAQILGKVAELTKSNASYEEMIARLETANPQQQGVPMNLIIGQQAQVRKAQLAEANNKSADIGILQAFAQGLQGNIQAAQETVNRAIDLRYQDREATVDLKMKQLQLLEGKLNKEESIQKAALERKYQVEQQQIADEKARAKENITLALENKVPTRFANKRGEIFDTNSGVAYATPEQFFKAANVKSFEEAYAKGLITDISQVSSIDLKQYPASYQEYLLAKQDGFTGNYNDYQNADANRKRSISVTNNISPVQKITDKFNTTVSSWNLKGTREQFIRQLQAQYPEIDGGDISRKVYEIYPNGYDSGI